MSLQDSSYSDTFSLPFASCPLLIWGVHRLDSQCSDWAFVRYGMAVEICLVVVSQVLLFVAALLSAAEILQRDLWRELMHGGGLC
jgi:hypothetical protein